MTNAYQGHHPDGSGVQLHNAGALYPYVIGCRQRQGSGVFVTTWYVTGPDVKYYECPTHEEAVTFAASRLTAYKLSAADRKIEALSAATDKSAPGPAIGLEADIRGQHQVGVRERDGVKSYYAHGPRADGREFVDHAGALAHINYLESDIYLIDRAIASNSGQWRVYEVSRNAVQ